MICNLKINSHGSKWTVHYFAVHFFPWHQRCLFGPSSLKPEISKKTILKGRNTLHASIILIIAMKNWWRYRQGCRGSHNRLIFFRFNKNNQIITEITYFVWTCVAFNPLQYRQYYFIRSDKPNARYMQHVRGVQKPRAQVGFRLKPLAANSDSHFCRSLGPVDHVADN